MTSQSGPAQWPHKAVMWYSIHVSIDYAAQMSRWNACPSHGLQCPFHMIYYQSFHPIIKTSRTPDPSLKPENVENVDNLNNQSHRIPNNSAGLKPSQSGFHNMASFSSHQRKKCYIPCSVQASTLLVIYTRPFHLEKQHVENKQRQTVSTSVSTHTANLSL